MSEELGVVLIIFLMFIAITYIWFIKDYGND